MSDKSQEIFSCFGIAVAAIILIAGLSVIHGWVLCILWGWFIVPFLEVPPMTIPIAIGVALIAGMLTPSNYKRDDDKGWTKIIANLLTPFLVLFLGWIVHLFM